MSSSTDASSYPRKGEWPRDRFYEANGMKRPTLYCAPLKTWSSACWRGYVADWAITDGKLFLVDVEAYAGWLGSQEVTIEGLFGKAVVDGRVVADWYTGALHLEASGRDAADDRVTIATVENGVVTAPEHLAAATPPVRPEHRVSVSGLRRMKYTIEGWLVWALLVVGWTFPGIAGYVVGRKLSKNTNSLRRGMLGWSIGVSLVLVSFGTICYRAEWPAVAPGTFWFLIGKGLLIMCLVANLAVGAILLGLGLWKRRARPPAAG